MTHLDAQLHIEDETDFLVRASKAHNSDEMWYVAVKVGSVTLFLSNEEQAAKLAKAAYEAVLHFQGKLA